MTFRAMRPGQLIPPLGTVDLTPQLAELRPALVHGPPRSPPRNQGSFWLWTVSRLCMQLHPRGRPQINTVRRELRTIPTLVNPSAP